jgi:membrane protease YdiL (CAAX protease family)
MNRRDFTQIILPILAICTGEILIFSGHAISGLIVHIINLQAIAFIIIGDKNFFTILYDQKIKAAFQSLILLLLLRVTNMAVPIIFTPSIFWISIIYSIMFIPIYLIMKNQNFTSQEAGFQCNRLNVFPSSYVPATIFIGYVLALIEFQIIQPEPVIDNLNFSNLIVLIIIMFFFVGTVEELIFRSILQTRLENALGTKTGLILASALFGIMHSGYSSFYELLFAGFAGLVIGFIYQKTRCLPFVVGIHGTINVLVFGILPLFLM